MNLSPDLRTTADVEAAADPVVFVASTGLTFEETTELFTTLWFGFLGQWGPPKGAQGRRQHCWRLQMMLALMEAIAEPYDGGDDPNTEVPDRWEAYINELPGFLDYWVCGCSWNLHGMP